MFDEYTHIIKYENHSSPSLINVNKPSTADDLRLLKEMEKEIEQNITQKIITTIEDNVISTTIVDQTSMFSALGYKHRYYAIFSINGKPFKIHLDIDDFDTKDTQKLMKAIYQGFSEQVVQQLLIQLDNKLIDNRFKL